MLRDQRRGCHGDTLVIRPCGSEQEDAALGAAFRLLCVAQGSLDQASSTPPPA